MNTIRRKITLLTAAIVTIALVFVVTASVVTNYSATMAMTEENLINISKVAAERVEWELNSYENIVTGLGRTGELADSKASSKDKQSIIDSCCKNYGFIYGSFIDKNGIDLNGTDHSQKNYFKNSMNGETTITEPIVYNSGESMTIIISAPVYADDNSIAGCIYVTPDPEFLNDVMKDVAVSENSLSYLIDSNGYTIADEDTQLILDGENCEEKYAAGDDGYKDTAELHSKARSGEAGFFDYYENGVRYFSGYAPVGING